MVCWGSAMAHGIRILAGNELPRGKLVKVPIVLELETRIRARSVHAEFLGAEESQADYTTTSTDHKGRTQTHHHTAVQQQEVVKDSFLLAGREPLGCMAGLGDSLATLFGGGRHTRLGIGKHEYEVAVTIPEAAPATLAGKKCRVFYELSVRVDRPLARDLHAKHSFVVGPFPDDMPEAEPIVVRYPEDQGRGFWDKMFGSDARLRLALETNRYDTAATVRGLFLVETEKALNIHAVRARLVGKESTRAQGHSDAHAYRESAAEICGPQAIQGSFSQEFELPIQISGPPSARGENFEIDWFVEAELDVPWAANASIRAPIFVAEAD